MDIENLGQLAVLRTVVGFLGEQSQNGWWPSSFFGGGSGAFLDPMFPRTRVLAQYHGACRAAAIVHDERIGIGSAYHLFRLPEDLEQSLHSTIQQMDTTMIAECIATPDAAVAYLGEISDGNAGEGIGPVHTGSLGDLREMLSWKQVAAHYTAGLTHRTEVYPYFADK